jgi:putative ABC transport system permease protein
MVRPPRLIRYVLARAAPSDLRRDLLDDLDELFSRRVASIGAARSRLWYARQAAGALPHLISIRRGRRAASRTRQEPRMGAFDKVIQDVRTAVRLMRRFPASTLAAVTTLAVCLGANTAIFSLVQAVLLRPLPYHEADRLVVIWKTPGPGETTVISLRELLGYRDGTPGLQQVAGYIEQNATFADGDAPDRVRIGTVSVNLFDTLRVQPARGVGFQAGDAAPGAQPTVILGHSLWTRQFAARQDIVGQMIRVSGTLRLVRGVMPEGFQLPMDYRAARATEAWLPMQVDLANLGGWGSRSIIGLGRLKDGVDARQVTSEFAGIGQSWIRQGFVADQGDGRMLREAIRLDDLVTGGSRRALLIVFAAVATVLLIACATVANLFLAKAESRRQEIAVRNALGAGRARIARQLLTESLMLAGLSGVLGAALAQVGMRVLQTIPATTIPRAQEAGLNSGVLLFGLALTLGTGLLFGLVPMLRLSRPDAGRVLHAGGRGAVDRARGHVRRALVVSQLAFAVILVVGAGLLGRSLVGMYQIDLGFTPDRVLTANTFLPVAEYATTDDVVQTYREIDARLAAVPGVSAAGSVRVLPLARAIGDWSIVIEGRVSTREENPNTDFQVATPGYFEAMGITPVRGRLFTTADDAKAPLVVVINDTMAARYWPGEDPIGKRFHLNTDDRPWLTIVGVIPTVRHNAVVESARAESYLPHAQVAIELGGAQRSMTLAIRTDGDPTALIPNIRQAMREVGPRLPLGEIQTMEDVTATALAQPRFTTMLLGLLAVLALALASLGVYSTVSVLVTERTREIGIRVALGAERGSILRLVAWEGVVLATVGLGVGIAGALLLTRLLEGLLYGVDPLDPLTFAAVPAVLAVLTLLACLQPARRAVSVDPAITLRQP